MRRKTPIEEIFDDLAVITAKIILRAILIFPLSLIAGTYISLKLLVGLIRNEIWLLSISLAVSIILYIMTVILIYDTTLDLHIKKICKSKMYKLEEYISDEMNINEFERRRLIRHLKLSSEKKFCNK